jgi:hypothetical protein
MPRREYRKIKRQADVARLFSMWLVAVGRDQLKREELLSAMDSTNYEAFQKYWPRCEEWYMELAAAETSKEVSA